MPQQLFSFSFSLGVLNRVEGAFPLSFYDMGGTGNAFTMAFDPQSTWGGMAHEDMSFADLAARRAGYCGDGLLAGNRSKQHADLVRFGVGDLVRKTASILEVLRPLGASRRIRSAYLPNQQWKMSKLIDRAGQSIDTVINATGFKVHNGTMEESTLHMGMERNHLAVIQNKTLDMARNKYKGTTEKGFTTNNGAQRNKRLAREDGFLDSPNQKKKRTTVVEETLLEAKRAPAVSILDPIVLLANKAYLNSMLREDFLFAKTLPHTFAVHDLIDAARAQMAGCLDEGIVSTVAPRQGYDPGTAPVMIDFDSSARPAWDNVRDLHMDIFDEYTSIWDIIPDHDDRKDLMIVPSRDFPYRNNLSALIDGNGVPYSPLSDPSISDVQVSLPVDHPFPDWADFGTEEVWVSLVYLKGAILELIQIWRGAKMKFAGMTLLQALNYMLEAYYDYLVGLGNQATLDQYRVFRLTRWFAERIVMANSYVVLRREYDSWTDKLYGIGDINTAAVIDGFQIDSATGILQTINPVAQLRLELTNYVNGEFSMSIAVPSGSNMTTLTVKVDGDLKRVVIPGSVVRVKIPVDAGTHEVVVNWDDPGGGQAILSGFVLTGAVFSNVTSTFEDPGSLQGNQAINLLIADLMKYYQDHWDQFKTKGSPGIRQRKPWLLT